MCVQHSIGLCIMPFKSKDHMEGDATFGSTISLGWRRVADDGVVNVHSCHSNVSCSWQWDGLGNDDGCLEHQPSDWAVLFPMLCSLSYLCAHQDLLACLLVHMCHSLYT